MAGPTGWRPRTRSLPAPSSPGSRSITAPDYNTVVADRNGTDKGTEFDLIINNDAQIANTPWAYYNWMFRQPDRGRLHREPAT